MLLSCPLCCKPHFEGVDSLRTTLVNVATSPLTCPVCKDTLLGLDKLTIHLFGHVNDTNSCLVTSEETIVNKNSENINIGQKYETNICQDPEISAPTLPNDNDVKASSKYDVPDVEAVSETITCDICSFTFSDRNILDMHQKLLHQTIPDKKTGQYTYHCHLCSKKFRMRGSLMVHLRVAHYGFSNHIELPPHLLRRNSSSSQVIQSKDRAEAESKGQNKTPDCKQWSCDVCAKLFTTKYFLKKHKRLHTGEMPYTCNICNKSFTFQQSFHKHMLYHSSEKPYICNECGRAFKEHSTLQNHFRIHSGERPFGCEICGKRFRQRVSYLVHMRIHTGVMPYKCTACNKSFRYKVSQKSHKCPINPPGAVIRVTDTDITSIATLLSQKIPKETLERTQNEDCKMTDALSKTNNSTKCILSVDYDTGNINFIPAVTEDNNSINKGLEYAKCSKLDRNINDRQQINTENDLCEDQRESCTIVSPILPQVASLCLNNSPISEPESAIEVIRQKCLDDLFN